MNEIVTILGARMGDIERELHREIRDQTAKPADVEKVREDLQNLSERLRAGMEELRRDLAPAVTPEMIDQARAEADTAVRAISEQIQADLDAVREEVDQAKTAETAIEAARGALEAEILRVWHDLGEEKAAREEAARGAQERAEAAQAEIEQLRSELMAAREEAAQLDHERRDAAQNASDDLRQAVDQETSNRLAVTRKLSEMAEAAQAEIEQLRSELTAAREEAANAIAERDAVVQEAVKQVQAEVAQIRSEAGAAVQALSEQFQRDLEAAREDATKVIAERDAAVQEMAERLRTEMGAVREEAAQAAIDRTMPKEWAPKEYAAGAHVLHRGGVWAARCSTNAREEPGEAHVWSSIVRGVDFFGFQGNDLAIRLSDGEAAQKRVVGNHRGAWQDNTVYEPLDRVALNGSTWCCVEETTSQPPGSAWKLEAQRGQRGPSRGE